MTFENDGIAPGVWRLSAGDEHAGARLDQFLTGQLTHLSRGQWRKVIDLGGAHVNGRRIRRCSTVVRAGDNVEAFLDGRTLQPYRITLQDIVFKDDYLIVLNKPAGVETQPTHARYVGTLYEALGAWLQGTSFSKHKTPNIGMIQRLDRDTSGLLVFSIHDRANAGLTHEFRDRRARKLYLALVHGQMKESSGEFRSLLARSRKGNLVKSVPAGGKEAITKFKVLASEADCTLVAIELLTGRSHQIRAHFSEAGHPLLGDTRYGGSDQLGDKKVARQQLHSWKLEFKHPVNGETMRFVAPPAFDMQELLDSFGWRTLLD